MGSKRVVINKLYEGALIPAYSHDTDSGADIFSYIDTVIKPWTVKKISTGISVELPDGYEFQVRSKSGIALNHNVFVLNSPGTIDTDYRGEIQVILGNFSDNAFTVKKGMKIAQLVLSPVIQARFVQLERLDKGFGSTGLYKETVLNTEPARVLKLESNIPEQEVAAVSESYSALYVHNDIESAGLLNGLLSME